MHTAHGRAGTHAHAWLALPREAGQPTHLVGPRDGQQPFQLPHPCLLQRNALPERLRVCTAGTPSSRPGWKCCQRGKAPLLLVAPTRCFGAAAAAGDPPLGVWCSSSRPPLTRLRIRQPCLQHADAALCMQQLALQRLLGALQLEPHLQHGGMPTTRAVRDEAMNGSNIAQEAPQMGAEPRRAASCPQRMQSQAAGSWHAAAVKAQSVPARLPAAAPAARAAPGPARPPPRRLAASPGPWPPAGARRPAGSSTPAVKQWRSEAPSPPLVTPSPPAAAHRRGHAGWTRRHAALAPAGHLPLPAGLRCTCLSGSGRCAAPRAGWPPPPPW